MTQQMQRHVGHAVLDDPCPRCGSHDVRAIVYGPFDFAVETVEVQPNDLYDDAPIFDCRECGFEWGLAVRDLLG
ncbi:hypothetical protein ACDF64_02555 [Agromyces sp. MMS24-JH15]|uniref:hypothetical protein n=1 Tax=Agromyces sp. MMS24-JH15 TaxID=3243765 RepID=UPI00374836EF